MKKTLLTKTMLLLCALIAGSSSVWAVDVEIAHATFNGKNGVYTEGWSTTGTGKGRTDCIIIGSGENITSPAFDLTSYSKVTITFSARRYGSLSGSKATVDASIGEVSKGTIDITSTSVGAVDGDINFEPTESMTAVEIVFTCTNATSAGSTHGAGIGAITIMGTPKNGGGEATKVATPTFYPGGNTYTVAQSVEITCDTEGATIHYTTNGDDPTESDATYSSAISVTKSGTVLKARAFKSGLTDSNIASATYTIKPTKPTITAPGTMVTITGPDGCDVYYTTDGTAPTKSSTKYTAPFELDADCTIKAKAFDTYDNGSDVSTLEYKYFPLTPKNVNSGYYVKVTDVGDLENGDAILLVNESNNVAMSTTQNSNNRGEEGVTISSNTITSLSKDVQKLVLVKTTAEIDKVETDVFYFYTGSGYLYAASSTSNYLRTEATPDNNARATISISSGDATIKFTGTYTRNLIQYNKTSSIFSCYSSNQQSVQIYKEVVPITITAATWASFSNAKEVAIPDGVTAYYASASAGSSVTLTEIEGGYIPANTGVVVSGSAKTYSANVTKTGATLAETNLLQPWTTAGEPSGTYYTLAVDGDKNPEFRLSTGGTLAAGKAYLVLSGGAPLLNVDFGGSTGLDAVRSKMKEVRGDFFDLQGRKVANPTKGLYIVNGKKVVVK